MDFKSQPFLRTSFYIDLLGSTDKNSLVSQIQRLGGSVENFLSRDVKYVVTNRTVCKQKDVKEIQIPNSVSPVSVQSPAYSGALWSPRSISSSSEDPAKRPAPSRSEQLLVKALTRDIYGSTDVIQNAVNLGIKVIHVDVLRKFLVAKTKVVADGSSANEKLQATSTKILRPMLKFESCDRKYRPHYKHFNQWPVLSLENTDGNSPFQVKNTKNDRAKDATTTTVTQVKPKGTMGPKRRSGVWKMTGYCEICTLSYKDLEQHLQSKEHKNFSDDASNYRKVDQLVKLYSFEMGQN